MSFTPNWAEIPAEPLSDNLFKVCADIIHARVSTARREGFRHATAADAVSDGQLEPLLEALGLTANHVASRGPNHVASRAAAHIRDWMTYLPRDCIRNMVRDGWHWST